MGRQRFTPEFKDEAVRQVTERGHPVTEEQISPEGGLVVRMPSIDGGENAAIFANPRDASILPWRIWVRRH